MFFEYRPHKVSLVIAPVVIPPREYTSRTPDELLPRWVETHHVKFAPLKADMKTVSKWQRRDLGVHHLQGLLRNGPAWYEFVG